MHQSKATEAIDQDRRRLLGAASIGVAVAGTASLLPTHSVTATDGDTIRPFRINVPEEALVDLRRRINATKWPERETVTEPRKACSSTRFRSWHAIGRLSTTGVRWK